MKRLLIVDDHDDFRRSLRQFLEKRGIPFRVLEADTGENAVVMAQRERPDVVIMDIRLPGIDGLEASRQIKAFLPNVRIIALTVFETEPLKRMFRSRDIATLLGKSEVPQRLVPALLRSSFSRQSFHGRDSRKANSSE